MANFRLYSGLFVEIEEDYEPTIGCEPLRKGQILQVMYVEYAISFVGVNGQYNYGMYGIKLKPIYFQKESP